MVALYVRRFGFLGSLVAAGVVANCVGSSSAVSPSNGADAGGFSFDGGSSTADAGGARVVDAAPDASESEDARGDAADAVGVNASDGGTTDTGTDAPVMLDDAGCPLPTGITVSLDDAGIPSNGLVLWLRSDVGVNTYATSDAGIVCRWDDVSGNGQSFTPASPTPPTQVSNALGTMPAVSFNGGGQNLSRAGVLGIGVTSARTVAVYEKTADTTTRFEPFFQGQGGTPGIYFGLDANTYDTVGSREGVYVTDNSYDSDIATTTNARSHILSINSFVIGTALPGALTYEVDGTLRTLTGAHANAGDLVEDFSAADFTSVGYGDPGFGGGVIGEVIVYSRELTAPERLRIENHFASRF